MHWKKATTHCSSAEFNHPCFFTRCHPPRFSIFGLCYVQERRSIQVLRESMELADLAGEKLALSFTPRSSSSPACHPTILTITTDMISVTPRRNIISTETHSTCTKNDHFPRGCKRRDCRVVDHPYGSLDCDEGLPAETGSGKLGDPKASERLAYWARSRRREETEGGKTE